MIDPNNTNSYSGYGNTVYNLVNSSIGGTFVGYTANPIDNTENRSIYFDGTNDYILYSSLGLTSGDPKSLFAWIKPSSISTTTGYTRLLNYMPDASNRFLLSLTSWNTPNNTYKISGTPNNNSATLLKTSNNYNLNEWRLVGWTFDGSSQNFYVDGVLQSSIADTSGSYGFTGNSGFIIGARTDTSATFYKGNVGVAQIYNRALSATEILQNYNATKKKYSPEENIVTNGLVLYIDPSKASSYPGTGNTIYDLSGFGNTGTLSAGLSFSALNGGSIVNDAGNKVLSYPSANFSTNNFTMEAWVSVRNYPSTNAVFISNRGTSDNGWLLDVTFNKKGRVFIQRDAGTSYSIETTNELGLNKWSNLSVVRNGTNLSMYRDGIFQNSTTLPSNYNIQSAYANDYVFRYFSSSGALDGNISSIKYYNRALSQQEILQNYNATKNRFINALPPVRNGLVLELDAGQRASYPGTGNTWYDLSGNNLNGELKNGPIFSGIGATSSLVLDRTNDHILVADNSLLNNFTGMTLEVIVKYTTTNDQIFAQKWNYSGGSQGYTLEIYTSAIVAACYLGGGGYLSVAISGYPINNTYHIILTLSGSTQTLYINGVSVASNSSGSVPSISGTNFTIGNRSNISSPYFGGNVYLTKFYNRGLSAYEVKQNFDYYRTRYNI
jgi:hypothetical protein